MQSLDNHVKLLFPTPIYTNYINLSADYKKELTIFIRDNISNIDNTSNPFHSKTTYFSESDMNHPIFDELISYIDFHVNSFASFLGIGGPHLGCKSLWSTISSYGQQHFIHHHGKCPISGVFYLQIPSDKRLTLNFQGKQSFNFHSSMSESEIDAQCKLKDTHEEVCETNKIVLFTGDTLHGFEPNPSNEEKIAIAFNYDYALK